jgi:ATP-dependent RNA helicase DDX46/PRP5
MSLQPLTHQRGVLQTDRESTINDFKTGACSILVATSIAARGLDVRDLILVVNYDTPNHLEEYVHRCGRTGRAGAAGTAITFLAHSDEQYAPDLVKALRDSGKPVPLDVQVRTPSHFCLLVALVLSIQ